MHEGRRWQRELLAGVLVGLLLALAFRVLLVLPLWTYYAAGPTAQEECGRVPIGASREEVLKIIGSSVPPEELLTIDGRIQASRRDRVCVIEFDASTNRVSSKLLGGR